MLKLPLCAALAAFGLAGAAAAPAKADPARMHLAQAVIGEPMLPLEVIRLVRAYDFDPITRPTLRGRLYILRAVDRGGAEVQILVDALAARIVSVRPLQPSARDVEVERRLDRRHARWSDRYPPEWGELPPPARIAPGPSARLAPMPDSGTGPRVIYAPHEAMPPVDRNAGRTVTLPVEHPPMPRSRPNEVAASSVSSQPLPPPTAAKPAAPVPVAKTPSIPDASPPF
jgi:hypothetical protein